MKRNVFDQYDQPENRLTHSLCCVLEQDSALVRPFLSWIGISEIPRGVDFQIAQQSIPGSAIEQSEGEDGLPDLCIYTDDEEADHRWGIFFEMKARSKLTKPQLDRHAKTAKRFGFDNPILVAITVEPISKKLSEKCFAKQWREVYGWLSNRKPKSFWVNELIRYFEVFEEKAINNDYEIRGTMTMFNGLHFGTDRPFQYREAKRLLRMLGDELQSRSDLAREVGIDSAGSRRTAITNDIVKGGNLWDYIPLKASKDQSFISFPHLTMDLGPQNCSAAVTIPNGIAGGFRTRLRKIGPEGFVELMQEIQGRLSPLLSQSNGATAFVYAVQRHYKSQRSSPQIDGRLEADLRTCVDVKSSPVKYQPEWIDAIYNVLVHKHSNIQCGVEARFLYSCSVVQSPRSVDLFAETWKAIKPLISFALDGESE